jgi:hypothetical protein
MEIIVPTLEAIIGRYGDWRWDLFELMHGRDKQAIEEAAKYAVATAKTGWLLK